MISSSLNRTGPATVNILVNSESAISLRLSINSGYVHYGYAGEVSEEIWGNFIWRILKCLEQH